ncbi:glycosyl transferase [Tepiditoga spiralis]|uniref:Glycosyl transferase n=1 Tax=Tepiditoga spiralis TaxID=2108365 RepID=A0A7G1G2S3_9BACT|nr:glycosyltransferase [Tepiditoga spiralis]BBE30175.1 glycosyl transferase [Tepiditoga spiralis]
MKILMITSLYPAYKNHSIKEISYALHNFITEWNKNNEVIVFRPYFIPARKKVHYEKKVIIDNITIYNVPVYRIPKLGIFFTKNIIKKLENIKFNPDKVICHLSPAFSWGYKIADRFNADFIVGIHNSDLKEYNKKYIEIFTKAKKIACRSKSIQNRLIEKYPQFKNKTFIANSGIDKNEIESKDFFYNKIDFWKNKDKINFITVSLLQKLKNIDINLKALANLKYKNWNYTIIGDGEEREYLENLVDELNLKDKVKFLGMKDRFVGLEYMKKSDVFIMASAPETFGLAFLEAMAKANIIIGAKGWGIDGIIKNNYNGFLVKPRNTQEMINVLNSLFESGFNEINKILLNSYDTINNYTQELMAKAYIDNIKE